MNERIRKLRRELDLTQEKFAERIGIKRNTVATYESGRNEPVDSVVSLICREFRVNEEWLRYGVGPMRQLNTNSELDALSERYNLSHGDFVLIEKFVNMKAESRDAIVDFIIQAADALSDESYKDVPSTPEELESKFAPIEKPNEDVG